MQAVELLLNGLSVIGGRNKQCTEPENPALIYYATMNCCFDCSCAFCALKHLISITIALLVILMLNYF